MEKKLNSQQLEAISHKKGPLLIIAGAGTGKTTVITERIKYLIEKNLARPSEILALTFTEKAAREMEERVDVAMPYGYTQMWISTFHSFCDRILRAEALSIGLDPKYKLMTEAETVQLLRKYLFSLDLNYFRPLGNPTKFISGMVQHFSRLQDEDVSPADYYGWALSQNSKNKKKDKEGKIESEKWLELAGAYRKYEEIKVKEGVMDFGDLIVKTLKLLRDRPNILKQYKKQFKYILVDEFQDTNYAQNRLAITLAGNEANITVTGDDDQSIYRFRGAAVSNILQFRKTYPKAKIVVLTKNYRTLQEILDKAYDLIQHNNPDRLEAVEKIDKKLAAQRKNSKGETHFIHKDRVENEAEAVARKVRDLVAEGQYQWKDFAILVRANNHSEPFIRSFQRNAVPYQFLGPGRLFRQPEVIDLISYLRVLYDFEDSVSFYRLLTIDYFDIDPKDLVRISSYARRYHMSLYDAAGKVDDIFISDDSRKKIKKVLDIVEKHIKLLKKETAGQLLYYFLEDSGLLTKLLNPDTADATKRAANISKFFDKLKTYEVDHQEANVPAVVDWIELSSELGESPLAADTDWTQVNAVNILTAHSAKGLEFPVVFLVNLVSQRFPTNERREQIPIPEDLIKEVLPQGDYHMQEERRLFYVGMTRARNQLYLTAADYYGEAKREKKLSPFIFEALGDAAVAAELPQDSIQQLSFLDYQPHSPMQDVIAPVQENTIHIDYLSYSQIEAFRICPLHYKLRYILNIPTPPSAAQSFGISIHMALKDFYQDIIAGAKPTPKVILEALKKNWVREGYKGKSHEEKSLSAAKRYLSDYYEEEFNPKKIPIALERPFIIPLGEVHGVRNKYKNERPLKIGGKIDRVDALPAGGIEIVDYKTGANVLTQKQIDADLQLSFYALAAVNVAEPPFKKNLGDVLLSLYYFDGLNKITTKRTQADLDNVVRIIYETRKQIENSDFKCSGNILCENCEYNLFCRGDRT